MKLIELKAMNEREIKEQFTFDEDDCSSARIE